MQKQINHSEHNISYRIEGEGTVLLLLHGFCEDSTMWDDFSAYFSKNYKVLRPDLPGFGDSDVIDPISIEEMATVLDTILAAEAIESCFLIGHSMGGYVAMAFAEHYAHKLQGLGLFHSHPFADTEEKKQNRAKSIGFMERWGSEAFVNELVPKLFAKAFFAKNPDFVAAYTAHACAFPQAGLIAATRAMIERPDRSAVLSTLKVPVLFIIGALDEAIPLELSNKQLDLSKNSSAYILEVGHMGMFEEPQHTIDMLDIFLDEALMA